ncbi:hypothetical protein K2Q00_03085 [Patescibacteria group bacterium]|nr:hypothetical protein [Patescibacteria group bacterium]
MNNGFMHGQYQVSGEIMLSIEQMLKIDPSLSELSEAELEELRASLYETAQIGFDYWREKKGGSKNPIRSLTSEAEDAPID